MCPRSATSPSLTSIIAVTPTSVRARAAAYSGRGRRWASTSRRWRSSSSGSPRRSRARPAAGPPEPADDDDGSARPSPRAQHREAAPEVSQRCHGDHHSVAGRDVTADNDGSHQLGLVGEPVGERLAPAHAGGRWQAQPDQQGRGVSAHRGNVSKVLRGRLAAQLVGWGPVPPEVPTLDEQIGRSDHPSVRCGENRGVVPGADQHSLPTPGAQPGGDPLDQPELAHVGDGRHRVAGHRAVHPPGDSITAALLR